MTQAAKEKKRQPFIEHIEELRSRFIWCLLSLAAGAIVGYTCRTTILAWLLRPIHEPLYYTSPIGGFHFLIKISFFFGLVCAIPVIIYNVLKFLEPALPRPLRHQISILLLASLGLMLVGVTFGYYISLPAALHFLETFNSSQIKAMISTDEYLSFILIYLTCFALVFQLPLLFLFINRIKPLSPGRLLKKLPWVILASIIIAAFMAPPDVINQLLLITPLVVLYLISVALIWAINGDDSSSSHETLTTPVKPAARNNMDIRRISSQR